MLRYLLPLLLISQIALCENLLKVPPRLVGNARLVEDVFQIENPAPTISEVVYQVDLNQSEPKDFRYGCFSKSVGSDTKKSVDYSISVFLTFQDGSQLSWINVCFNENQAWVRAERVYAPKKAIKTATVKLVYKRAGKAEFKEPFFETVIHRPAKIDSAVGDEWQKIGLLKQFRRDLNLDTKLDNCAIVLPKGEEAANWGAKINDALLAATGKSIPIVKDDQYALVNSLDKNLIVIGNRHDNATVDHLYLLHYVILDCAYPGSGGYVVRTLHNPFGDGHNIVFAGGSDRQGTGEAVEKLAEIIRAAKASSLPRQCVIRLGAEFEVPESGNKVNLWEESRGYGKAGYFGWNSLSRNLAMHYMTGEKRFAREFIRLAFPKTAEDRAELFKLDDESYRDIHRPLAEPYHYRSIMVPLYWDLVEESDAFTDEEREAVTRELYAQLVNRFLDRHYYNIHNFGKRPLKYLPDRHLAWEAVTVFVTARYFARQYDCFDGKYGLELCSNAFWSLDHYASCIHTSSFFWYNTFIEPFFHYAALSGGRNYLGSKVLKRLAEGLAAFSEVIENDWSQAYSSSAFLGMAACLTQDQAFVTLREKLNLAKSPFRAGQSYLTIEPYEQDFFKRESGRFYTYAADTRGVSWNPPFDVSEVIEWMSYREKPGDEGDFLLIDPKYGTGGRIPAHNFNLLTLRLGKDRLLHGYANQIFCFADGLANLKTCDLAHVTEYGSCFDGDTVFVKANLKDYNGFDWTRAFIVRRNQWLVACDELKPVRSMSTCEIMNRWQPASQVISTRINDDFQLTLPRLNQPESTEGLHLYMGRDDIAKAVDWKEQFNSSNRLYVCFNGVQVGTVLTIPFTLEKPASGNLRIKMGCHAGRRGRLKFKLDGKTVVEDFDHKDPKGAVLKTLELGQHQLAAGNHKLEVESLTIDEPTSTIVGMTDLEFSSGGFKLPSNTWILSSSIVGEREMVSVSGGRALEFRYEGEPKSNGICFATVLGKNETGEISARQSSDEVVDLKVPSRVRISRHGEGVMLQEANGDIVALGVKEVPNVFKSEIPVVACLKGDQLEIRCKQSGKLTMEDGRTLQLKPDAPNVVAKVNAKLSPLPNIEDKKVEQTKRQGEPKGEEWKPVANGRLPTEHGGCLVVDGNQWAASSGKQVALISSSGQVIRIFELNAIVGALWLGDGLLVAGCRDEKVVAFQLSTGERLWEFKSEMSDGLVAGSQFYWFKSALPGVSALSVCAFEGDEKLLFVGSTSTVEVLELKTGRLLARKQTEYGYVTGFEFVPGDGNKRQDWMLVYRRSGGFPTVYAFDKSLNVNNIGMGVGTDGQGMGNFGYSGVGRGFLVAAKLEPQGDLKLVGDFNGVLNRVGVWNATGQIQHDVSFGDGFQATSGNYGNWTLRNANIKDLKVGDLDGDKIQEIIVAYNRRRIFAFNPDLTLKKLWILDNTPTALATLGNRLVAGCTNGTIIELHLDGTIRQAAKLNGTIVALSSTNDGKCIAVTNKGEWAIFQ